MINLNSKYRNRIFGTGVKRNLWNCRGSLLHASSHYNFKTFLMGIPEKPKSAQIVYMLGLLAPGCLKHLKHFSKKRVDKGIKMFLERRTSVKMDLSAFDIRFVKVTVFSLSN